MSHVVVTGGAGFIGSHLCEALLDRGDSVTVFDDFSSGSLENLAKVIDDDRLTFIEADVSEHLDVDFEPDFVVHLASPASPNDYLRLPLETLAVGSRGTENALELATRSNSRFIFASTSEVYGDPLVHPQVETYWGNVNPIGPRSVYDEAKRFGEALTIAYIRHRATRGGIVRIFNTYGPRLRPNDGRVVSNFIDQALAGMPITIYGDGNQTRSFCFVDDTVRGLIAVMDSGHVGPFNLGNPAEQTVSSLADSVRRLCGSTSVIEHRELPIDDPTRRQPDISRIEEHVGWRPEIDIEEGLSRTIAWFREMNH